MLLMRNPGLYLPSTEYRSMNQLQKLATLIATHETDSWNISSSDSTMSSIERNWFQGSGCLTLQHSAISVVSALITLFNIKVSNKLLNTHYRRHSWKEKNINVFLLEISTLQHCVMHLKIWRKKRTLQITTHLDSKIIVFLR